jgi:hypothetical protein
MAGMGRFIMTQTRLTVKEIRDAEETSKRITTNVEMLEITSNHNPR